MSRIKPSVLFIGVAACVPVLALHRFGVFSAMAVELGRLYQHHALLVPGARVSPMLSFVVPTVLAFLTAFVCLELPKVWRRVAFVVALLCLTGSLSMVLALKGVVFEPFSSFVTIALAGTLAMVFGQTERGQRVHRFREFFVGRLSEADFETLVQGKEPVKLTGKRSLTSLTCRLLNSSELAPSMEAEALELMSSAFLKAASEFLVARGAYLDVCNSQGLTVQLGFPVGCEDHAVRACKLALELREFLEGLGTEFDNRWQRRPSMGIAVASGECVCGLIGHGSFQFYSALGEAPELSRRLCNMNGVYGSRVLISTTTFALVKDEVEVRPMEMLAAPGQTGLREVYELLAEKGNLTKGEMAVRDAFWQGVVALRQGDAEAALAKLRQAIVVGKEDGPLKYFKELAESKQRDAKSHVRRSEHAG